MKTYKVNVQLSDSEIEGAGIFHNLKYSNDGYGGNQNQTVFEIRNESGNAIHVELGNLRKNEVTKEWDMVWQQGEFDSIRIKLYGALENRDFLTMLQMIVDAERITDIINPTTR